MDNFYTDAASNTKNTFIKTKNDSQVIKVIHIVPTLGAGGTERNCAHLIKGIKHYNSYDNYIVALRPGDESFRNTFEEISENNLTTIFGSRFQRVKEFNRYLKNKKPEVVVFHLMSLDQALLACVARHNKVKYIVASAGNPAPDLWYARFKVKVIILINKIVKCPIISASYWIQSTLAQVTNLPKGSCVVHNGVDTDNFLNKDIVAPKQVDKKILGMIARLDHIKNHELLFKAISIVVNKRPDLKFELRIIGDGPLRVFLSSLVTQLNLSKIINFYGTKQDIPEQLSQLDAFVFSTTSKEGFGNVLIEAMATGIPIFASDVPSSREVLCEGKFGTLLPAKDAEAWANALLDYIEFDKAILPPNSDTVKNYYGLQQFSEGYSKAINASKIAR